MMSRSEWIRRACVRFSEIVAVAVVAPLMILSQHLVTAYTMSLGFRKGLAVLTTIHIFIVATFIIAAAVRSAAKIGAQTEIRRNDPLNMELLPAWMEKTARVLDLKSNRIAMSLGLIPTMFYMAYFYPEGKAQAEDTVIALSTLVVPVAVALLGAFFVRRIARARSVA